MRKKEAANTNKPTKKLEELIDLIRYVPADYPLPAADSVLESVFLENTATKAPAEWILQQSFHEKEAPFYESIPGADMSGSFEALCKAVEAIRQMLQTDCPLVVENILPESGGYEEVFLTWSRYQDYVQLQHQFKIMLSWLEQFRPYGFEKEKIPYYTNSQIPGIAAVPELDENNRITFQNNFLTSALEGADPNRLRQCEVCGRVFWAYRLNAKFCEKKCADVHFQQQRRADQSKAKKINDRRRENYRRKKEAKELKGGSKKENGTL